MRHTLIETQSNTEAGFSLVEIMLALAIMAVGLIAIIGLIPRGVQASREAADNTIVATIVHDTFNDLRRQAFSGSFPPVLTTTYYDVAGTNQFTAPSPDTYYQMQFLTPSSTPNLLTIAAVVTWPVKSATSVPANTNVFVTQIAKYQ